METQLTPEVLAAIGGTVISLLFSYIPGLRTKWAALKAEVQRSIMLGIMILLSGGIYFLGCKGIVDLGIACAQSGILQLVTILIFAATGNQVTYGLSPQAPTVVDARAARDASQ